MFGDKNITGEKMVLLKRNSISLPNFVETDSTDKIYGHMSHDYDKNGKYILKTYQLFSEKEIEDRIISLKENLKKMKRDGKDIVMSIDDWMRYYCGTLSFMWESPSKNHTLHVDKRLFTEIPFQDKAYLVGVQKHVNIYTSYEDYLDTLVDVYFTCSDMYLDKVLSNNILLNNVLLYTNIEDAININNVNDYVCHYKVPKLFLKQYTLSNNTYFIDEEFIYKVHLFEVFKVDYLLNRLSKIYEKPYIK